jgi:hypothetical protein
MTHAELFKQKDWQETGGDRHARRHRERFAR